MTYLIYIYIEISLIRILAIFLSVVSYRLIWSWSIWSCSIHRNKIEINSRRDGRVVDSSGLENRYSSLFRTIEGSNPSLSFCLLNIFVSLFVWPGPLFIINKNGSARWDSRARTEKTRQYGIE